jgi:hypothetical protein
MGVVIGAEDGGRRYFVGVRVWMWRMSVMEGESIRTFVVGIGVVLNDVLPHVACAQGR